MNLNLNSIYRSVRENNIGNLERMNARWLCECLLLLGIKVAVLHLRNLREKHWLQNARQISCISCFCKNLGSQQTYPVEFLSYS